MALVAGIDPDAFGSGFGLMLVAGLIFWAALTALNIFRRLLTEAGE